jgi:spore coat polysaccharide biosynthesis predicted glycosyltransferase SpsG
MKIDIITDGNNKLGMGHVYQVITIVRYLLETNSCLDIRLYTKSNQVVETLLRSTKCKIEMCSDDEEILQLLLIRKPDSIVFDKLDVSPVLAKNIKSTLDSKLLIFTNLTKANEYADVTLLADIGSNFENIYKKDTVTGRVEIFGPKYWILRPDFYLNKVAKKEKSDKVNKILLMFGGSDPSNFSTLVLEELLRMDHSFELSLIIGPSFAHVKELNEVLSNNQSKSKVLVYKNISNVAEMMSESDLVLASPGLSFFESLVVGIPVIGFHQDELQKEAYQCVFKTFGKGDVCFLSRMIREKEFIFPSDAVVQKMAIGEGKSEIIKEILSH